MNNGPFIKAMLVAGCILLTGSAGRTQVPAPTAAPTPAPVPTTDQSQSNGPAATGPVTTAPVDINALQPTGKITQITIIGNKNIPTSTVQAEVTETVGEQFDPATAERDAAAITALGDWTSPARFAATPDMKGGLDLTFSVTENPVVQAIVFNANTLTGQPTIPAATLLAQMQTQTGQVLNTNTLARDLDILFNPATGYAHRQGYRFLAGASVLDPTTGILTIPVIESYVQAVIVTGNGKTKTADILNQLPVKPGDLYNDAAVQQIPASLNGTGHVRSVGQASVMQTVPGRVVVTVPVTDNR